MRPKSIVNFDRLFLASFVLGLINFALGYDTTIARLKADPAAVELGLAGAGFIFGVLAFSTAISVLLWFLVSRRASNAARWILTVLAVLGMIGMPFSLAGLPVLTLVVTVAVAFVQMVAVWLLFRPDAALWFEHGPHRLDPRAFE